VKQISLLISPEVKSAFFNEYIECSLAELNYCFPTVKANYNSVGNIDLISFEIDESLLQDLSKLSFFQGAFENIDNKLIPLDITPEFKLHDNFIFGSKFKGKTNERFTQMMLNIGLASIEKKDKVKVLDPMCGRGTSLLWSMRYGYNAKGIEVDAKSILDINQIVKKWSKVCEVPSKVTEGFISKKTKSNVGKFLEFSSQGNNMKVIIGNSIDSSSLLRDEKFDLIITDIPYGIQHLSNKGAINPIKTLEQCLPEWIKCLNEKGAIVIGFNANNPKRKNLENLISNLGFSEIEFKIPHRMSESIVRDVIILKK
jgi:hypothetical protein